MQNEELKAAEAHIARLEDELLRLKDVRRDLQALRAEHARLRRSAQGRIARFLSAPFRLLRRDKTTLRSEYELWLQEHRISDNKAAALRQQVENLAYRPLVSVLTATFQPREEFLSAAIDSVRSQVYDRWELVIVDDGSKNDRLNQILQSFTEADTRIHFLTREERGGISRALNTALAMASGEWIALLDHDDLLEPDAIFRGIELLQNQADTDVIYSDEDKIIDDRFAAPMLKPDWAPELFLTHDYLGHFLMIRRHLLAEGFRPEFDGAQDYEVLLRIAERTDRIRHIPRVLYHWRRTSESTAHNIRRKPGALEAGRAAVQDHLKRRGINAEVAIDWETHTYRPRYQRHAARVSICLLHALDGMAEALRKGTEHWIEVITPAKFSEVSKEELLLLLDADLEPMQSNWLSAMIEQFGNAQVGAVGARILQANGSIESAGYVLMPDGTAKPAFADFTRNHPGVNRQLKVIRNYSAVSASCLLTRTELLEGVFGHETTLFLRKAEADPVCAGVEYCLQLRELGCRVVSVPQAELQRRSNTAPSIMYCCDAARRWPEIFRRDPYYNPNLSRERADFSLGTG